MGPGPKGARGLIWAKSLPRLCVEERREGFETEKKKKGSSKECVIWITATAPDTETDQQRWEQKKKKNSSEV